ncbi:Protein tilB [Lonchura striata]|uniref:Protein tilB n=1 Tax=Lonchura striata TaxID=40157 RepID=A0A218V620_9PASE|nr:Protein tilB [Lonchura striata domestica]
MGNPCTEFEGYRQFVVATLQQLKYLDSKEIERSERIKALQNYPEVKWKIREQEQAYLLKRAREKEEGQRRMQERKDEKQKQMDPKLEFDSPDSPQEKPNQAEGDGEQERCRTVENDDEDRKFWDEPTPYTPESRLETHRYIEEKRRAKDNGRESKKREKTAWTLVTAEGKVLNVNVPKLHFSLKDDEENNQIILDLAVYSYAIANVMGLTEFRHCKHLDTSLLDVDVQPTYIRVLVKGKLVLPEEVKPDSSSAKRSQTTGHLVVTMPKVCKIGDITQRSLNVVSTLGMFLSYSFPGEPAQVPKHPLAKEPFPNIQPKPSLTQLQAIPLGPDTSYLREEISACLSYSSHEDVEDLNEASPPSPPGLRDKEIQPLLIRPDPSPSSWLPLRALS